MSVPGPLAQTIINIEKLIADMDAFMDKIEELIRVQSIYAVYKDDPEPIKDKLEKFINLKLAEQYPQERKKIADSKDLLEARLQGKNSGDVIDYAIQLRESLVKLKLAMQRPKANFIPGRRRLSITKFITAGGAALTKSADSVKPMPKEKEEDPAARFLPPVATKETLIEFTFGLKDAAAAADLAYRNKELHTLLREHKRACQILRNYKIVHTQVGYHVANSEGANVKQYMLTVRISVARKDISKARKFKKSLFDFLYDRLHYKASSHDTLLSNIFTDDNYSIKFVNAKEDLSPAAIEHMALLKAFMTGFMKNTTTPNVKATQDWLHQSNDAVGDRYLIKIDNMPDAELIKGYLKDKHNVSASIEWLNEKNHGKGVVVIVSAEAMKNPEILKDINVQPAPDNPTANKSILRRKP